MKRLVFEPELNTRVSSPPRFKIQKYKTRDFFFFGSTPSGRRGALAMIHNLPLSDEQRWGLYKLNSVYP
jgi:hypothetical protein